MSQVPVHFLHVPKTGGSAIRAALEPVAQSFGLQLHRHKVALADIPNGEGVVVFLRHPVTRFISAFNSRLRRGAPHHQGRHTKREEIAFAQFQTPNALAEALASGDADKKAAAEFAINVISHTRRRLIDMLGSIADVKQRRRDLVFIGFQEALADDFERLKQRLSLPASLALPADDIVAHRMPPGFDTELSQEGRSAIKDWYREDIELFRYLRSVAAELSDFRSS
ncbi:MAG: sulfotransferase family 2 domain-containing protein [Alphaproteobacteria bacterium]|nr:sulfotransferase family 2 domain-containing protein [Alphaproteobacteria bacterium]